MSLIFASQDSYYLFYQKPTRITNSADEIQQYSSVTSDESVPNCEIWKCTLHQRALD